MEEKLLTANTKPYYIGLDIGTNSVGWAVTDEEYRLQKAKGKALWGVRLFEEAKNASERRTSRVARRRIARKKQRLMLLETLFAEELSKADPNFLKRMHESDLWEEDKSTGSANSLFADRAFTDKDYHKRYPTVYHLRSELVRSQEPHDVRLVYLALHHIMKSRGHFLYDTMDSDDKESLNGVSTGEKLEELCRLLEEAYDTVLDFTDKGAFLSCLQDGGMRISVKGKQLKSYLRKTEQIKSQEEQDEDNDVQRIDVASLADMLSGSGKVKLSKLFGDESLKDIGNITLQKDLDEQIADVGDMLGDRAELLMKLKEVFDAARLSSLLKKAPTADDPTTEFSYLCQAKVQQYEQNGKDLRLLKRYVKKTCPEKYSHIFSEKKKGLDNYAAYSRYGIKNGEYTCGQEAFCKFLRSIFPKGMDGCDEIYVRIQENTFLPRLRSSDNGVIPYQLQRRELVKILENASAYLPFLKEKGTDGYTVIEKVIMTFEFRIPYYVGPVSSKAAHRWAVRFAGKEGEKVYPWNFENIVDTEATASAFMEELVGRCTYTGEKVLPKDSLLYGEFSLLNELNPLRLDGHPLPTKVKEKMVQDLFFASSKKVTKKAILGYLSGKGLANSNSEITGIDHTVKTVLKSRHDFRSILERTGDRQMVEDVIRAVLVFGEDKTMLRNWLNKHTHGLTEQDKKYICRLKYKDWGRLSDVFLEKIEGVNRETGEIMTIMDALRTTDCNLMQLLAEPYDFAEKAAAYRDELLGNCQSLDERLEDMYISPAVRRSLRQTLRIVDEIVGIQKAAPSKIFVEMARGGKPEDKGTRTVSRKEKLLALYRNCGEQESELFHELENTDEGRLRHDALYLYYTQLGKCMYSGDPIELSEIDKGYDKDHIFPRSKIKDDSIDNLVLVKNVLNREKSNTYPIGADIRNRMASFWAMLLKKKLISPKKYERLIRAHGLTADELSAFVARQLTQTRQSTKALTVLLQEQYKDTRIVFSKAGNVSEFRQKFDLIKCRDINDLHHAKDAYLNIVVGNVYDTKFTKRFFLNIQREEYNLKKIFESDTPRAWKTSETIQTVKTVMAKNNILVTRMPKEVRGALFDLQIMPAGKGQLEKKAGMPIEKYGGYNKLTGAYFFVAEYTEKKKRVRAIQPVYLHQKALYEKDSLAYCRQILGLENPKIICRRILTDSLLELDGQRLCISGRTSRQLLFKHTYQLAADALHERYIKDLGKYTERCAEKKAELPVTEYDGLSKEGNLDLYDWFLEKSRRKVYADLLKSLCADMETYRDKFASMPMLGQAKLLLEILKSFQCNSRWTNFTELCQKGSVSIIVKSMNISKLSSAYLINQSVTGVYENKVNLLE